MSNALFAAATTASSASRPAAPSWSGRFVLSLAALGICVLAVWIVPRIVWPAKLSLRRTPGRHTNVHPLHVLALFAFWQLTQQALLTALKPLAPAGAHWPLLIAGIVGQAALLLGAAVLAASTFRLGLRRGMGLNLRHGLYDSVRGVLAYLAVFPICVGLYELTNRLAPCEPHVMLKALRSLTPAWKALTLLSTVVLAPAAEEMFFRGLLQSLLRRYLGAWRAVFVASVLFALVHYAYWNTLPSIFVLGIALGYNYERTGRLTGPILTHALFNGVNSVLVLTGAAPGG